MPKILPRGKATNTLRFGTLDEILFIDEKMSQLKTPKEKREWLQSYRQAWERRDNWGGINRAKVFAAIDRWLGEV